MYLFEWNVFYDISTLCIKMFVQIEPNWNILF